MYYLVDKVTVKWNENRRANSSRFECSVWNFSYCGRDQAENLYILWSLRSACLLFSWTGKSSFNMLKLIKPENPEIHFYTSRVFQWKSIIIDSSLLFSLFFIILILCNKQNADGHVLLIWVRVIGKTILFNNLLTKALILKSLCTWVFDYYIP